MIEHLITLLQAYAKGVSRSPHTVSMHVFGRPEVYKRLINGSDINVRTYEQGMAWLVKNWPEGLPWPDGVPKPQTGDAI